MVGMVTEVWHKVFDYPNDASVQERLVEPENYGQERILDRLVHYHRHIGEIIDSYKHVYKTVNADQPKTDVFSQGEGRDDKIALPVCASIVVIM